MVGFSESSLKVSQLAEATVIDPQSAPPFVPEERFYDPCNDLEILGNLISDSATDGDLAGGCAIEVSESERLSRYARFAHFSVQKYLLHPPGERCSN
jgi:hypothetical protein